MGERCEIQMDKPYYHPGDTINGFVIGYFNSENNVRDIRVKFKGIAKVHWKSGKTHYRGEETYFEMESSLLASETTFQPGSYSYPFVFTLPVDLPSSVTETEGNIKYQVKATIDKPWAPDFTAKKNFFVYSYVNLNHVPSLQDPAVFTQEKTYLFGNNEVTKIVVQLPKTGYILDEMISFTCSVRNNSSVKVKEILFNFVQGFELITKYRNREILSMDGQTFAITNGTVLPFSEQTWDLQIRVPSNVYNGNIQHCEIIRAFWELRGEVRLPLMYSNLNIRVPITIGSIPFVASATTKK